MIAEWRQCTRRLSEIEREHFGWDHAQAGAWVLQSWEFPEEMVCYIGAHDLTWEGIREHELQDTIVAPVAVAAISPSVLKPDSRRSRCMRDAAQAWLSMTDSEFVQCVTEARESLGEILELFGLPDGNAGRILDEMAAAADFTAKRKEHETEPTPGSATNHHLSGNRLSL